jgi:L-ascorbate metabolism protein UlaG (beta-lactamase superfamily)
MRFAQTQIPSVLRVLWRTPQELRKERGERFNSAPVRLAGEEPLQHRVVERAVVKRGRELVAGGRAAKGPIRVEGVHESYDTGAGNLAKPGGIERPMEELLSLTYIGGPTALLEFGGVRLLTDPTFDTAGGEYPSGAATLRKLSGPALTPAELAPIDYVLLSHDHHFDNLDRVGRAMLPAAKNVLTTEAGAKRLGGNSIGLGDWQSIDLATREGRTLRVVATPARHGPAGMDRGAVTGFALFYTDAADEVVYFSGDTVWYEGVERVSRRFSVCVALLNLGAAQVPEVGPFHLTMTADEAVEAARAFASATIVPLHFEGWAHFTEGREQIAKAFADAGLEHRLRWGEPGRPRTIEKRRSAG